MPAGWSPDGTSVLLHATAICAEEAFADVAMVGVDGTGLRQIGDLQGTELNPRWSPDGSLIAFEGPEGLYVVGPDGTGVTLLGPGLNPRWAPSSDQLAFVRASDPVDESSYDVWAVAPSASAPARQVEASTVLAGAPQWSGDGTLIGFVGSANDATELYFVAASGGEPVLGSISGGANVMALSFQPSPTRPIAGPDRYETAAAIARATASVPPSRRISRTPRSAIAVQRIAGSDRAKTATLLADHFADERGAPFTHVNLARGDSFPDALAGAPHGGTEQAPILFTQSSTELGATTREWLRAHADEIDSIHVFGGTRAVSDAVLHDARQAATAG